MWLRPLALFPAVATAASVILAFCALPAGAADPEPAPSAEAPAGATMETDPETQPSPEPLPRLAVLLPPRDSPLDEASYLILNGIMASNYISRQPAELLLVRPDETGSALRQAERAAAAGALAAIGPLDRRQVDELARAPWLPLPIVTLNKIDIDDSEPLSAEEIERLERERAARAAAEAEPEPEAVAPGPTPAPEPAPAPEASADASSDGAEPSEEERPVIASISEDISVKGFEAAADRPPVYRRWLPRQFPRDLLLFGLSTEEDARYVAGLGLRALPEKTKSGERPKVLLIEGESPLEKRLSMAFDEALRQAGVVPDKLTLDIDSYATVSNFFSLVIDQEQLEEEEEIDPEVDPLGWRQQQLRLRRLAATLRARAALAEPPYYGIFLALEAPTASLIRSRLPLRSRLWGTSAINPGDTGQDSTSRAMIFDLLRVGFVETPFALSFKAEEFEERYQTEAPRTLLGQRLFALGADALELAWRLVHGALVGRFDGLSGAIFFDLEQSPLAHRAGQPALITPEGVVAVSPDEIIDSRVVSRRLAPEDSEVDDLPTRPAREAGETPEDDAAEPDQPPAPDTAPAAPDSPLDAAPVTPDSPPAAAPVTL